ncbi:uncharacterized protein FA14DRAFT_157088 [Meira miltonrushii]|uniref:Uncharacterized protein n=1 Tax=Meira miltonrushii TaxID=1280837 RepID=A0A316VDT1_9BASI|nr:uncharacterized protein FA14DRAFT_157088 [Meira miltonrushii]PWN34433.1 hypothetical protein FA14DRAFT_157088 [Meira miltonrushii]
MMGKTSNAYAKLPWLATFATCLQWISLILITLILVCPSPWEHNSVSLFVITPQQSNTVSISVPPPSSTSSSVSPSIAASQPASNDPASSTSSLPAHYPAIQTAAAQSGANVKREPIDDTIMAQQPQIKEVISNSSFPSPLGGGVNVTSVNVSQLTEPSSWIQLRIGPLGSCFRTADGRESCTPAKLAASYQYKGLQGIMNTTASPGINVQELLPDSMTFYATVLLLLTIMLLCVCIFTTTHLVLLFRHNKQLQQSTTASQAITTFFKPTSMWKSLMTAITKWFLIVIAMILVVASAIQKYRLSNAKNSFNSANPIANGSVALQADTGDAFGFAWVSTILLIITFWLQRTANRRENALDTARKELQKTLPQHLINNDADGKSGGQSTLIMSNLSRSATLPPYTPPPTQGSQEQGYFPQDSKRGNTNELDSFAYGLPSLQKAYESTGRLNAAKSSPPFQMYQSEFGHRQQQALAGSPLRQMNSIPSSSTLKLHQQPQLGHMPSLHYDQSSFGNNTYVHEQTYDLGDYSYNTEVLAEDGTPNTCDCSFGRNRLDCSYHSTNTTTADIRNRRLSGLLRQNSQNSHSTFGHHIQRIGGQSSHRLGGMSYNSSSPNGKEDRCNSPAPSYWTSSSAPAGSSSTTTPQQQESARQEKERQRIFMAELRAQRAAMHSH